MKKPEGSKGIMIAFEGSDGAGKSTAMAHVYEELLKRGFPVITTREPGGSPLSEQIRNILLDPENEVDPKTEALLYAASRRQHLVSTILPALEEGKIVLCDRFLDSSIAYQGFGRDLNAKTIEHLNDFGLEGFRPDATLFFELDRETSAKRINLRGNLNRLDQEKEAFFSRVADGFEAILKTHPEYCRIDASASIEDVANQTMKQVDRLLEEAGYDR